MGQKHLGRARVNKSMKLLTNAGGPKAGVSNVASALKSSFDANLTFTIWPHCAFVGIRLPLSESRITVFPGGNIKISNVLKISPRCAQSRWVKDIKESVLILIFKFFHQSRMARAGPKKL